MNTIDQKSNLVSVGKSWIFPFCGTGLPQCYELVNKSAPPRKWHRLQISTEFMGPIDPQTGMIINLKHINQWFEEWRRLPRLSDAQGELARFHDEFLNHAKQFGIQCQYVQFEDSQGLLRRNSNLKWEYGVKWQDDSFRLYDIELREPQEQNLLPYYIKEIRKCLGTATAPASLDQLAHLPGKFFLRMTDLSQIRDMPHQWEIDKLSV